MSVAAGLVADRLLGEPPRSVHPVVAFGRVMRALEAWLWRDGRATGVGYTAAGTALGTAAGWLVGTTAGATAVAAGGEALACAAAAVGDAVESQLTRIGVVTA